MSTVVAIRGGRESGIVGRIDGSFTAIQAKASKWKTVAFRTFMAFPRALRFVKVSRLRTATDHERNVFEMTLELQGGVFGDERRRELPQTPRAARRARAEARK